MVFTAWIARARLTLANVSSNVASLTGVRSAMGLPLLVTAISACLVRMSELHTGSQVFTLDSDFRVYRRHGREAIPLITP